MNSYSTRLIRIREGPPCFSRRWEGPLLVYERASSSTVPLPPFLRLPSQPQFSSSHHGGPSSIVGSPSVIVSPPITNRPYKYKRHRVHPSSPSPPPSPLSHTNPNTDAPYDRSWHRMTQSPALQVGYKKLTQFLCEEL